MAQTRCIVCGVEIQPPNKITCSRHSRHNSAWKSYNKLMEKLGRPALTWEQYREHRAKHQEKKRRPRLFRPEDMTGPTVTWDGSDRSPCARCEHGMKDHHRYGCVTCGERFKFAIGRR